MCIEQASGIDWNAVGAIATAFAAGTALLIWLVDGNRRKAERKAAARLLAQSMIAPVAAAQIDVAAVRHAVAPPDGSTWLIHAALASKAGRDELAGLAVGVNLELPPQFLDKADLFSEEVSNKLAYALTVISRLKVSAKLLSGLSDTSEQQDIDQHTHLLLTLIKEAADAVDEAYNVLLVAGRASR